MTRRRTPPLAHLRVLDLTDLRGAIAGRILAELGADVLMLEPPGGAPGRMHPPFAGETTSPDRSLAFLFRNAGKRSATIDLDTSAGRARLAELLDDADVVVENFPPEERRRLGLEPAELRRRYTRIIHVAIADFGLSGPRAHWRLEPLPAFAACGALHGSGLPELPPCWIPGFVAHDCAAILGVAGALAAILAQGPATDAASRTIEISVQEAALAGLTPWSIPVADYARVYPLLPVAPPRDGDGPYFVLPTAGGGWVRVVAVTPRQIAGLLRLLWPWSQEPERRRDRGEGRPSAASPRSAAPASPAAAASGFWIPALGARSLARLANGVASGLAEIPRRAIAIATSAVVMASRLAPLPGATLAATRSTLSAARAVAGAALRRRRRDAALAAGRRLRVPIAPVLTPDEYAASEQARARGAFLTTRFPHLRGAPFAPLPFRMTASPPRLARGAPSLAASVPAERAAFAERAPAPDAAATMAAGTRGDARRRSRRGAAPLAGVRVVELTVGAAVPEIGWLLAELGADVVKIESTANVDFLRRVTIEPDTPNRSWMFNDSNRGKRSVCIDLRTPRGRDLAIDLCAAADVVLENSRGGVAEALGVAYGDVRRRRPDVVYLSSQGYGRGGPLGEAPSYGPLVSAMSGVTWLQNHPDAPYPAGSTLNHPDHAASKLGVVAVLAALEHRRRTGEGQHVEMAQTDVAAFLAGPAYLEKPCTGNAAAPRGNACEAAAPHGVYPCAGDDRWCAIAVASDEDWQRLRRHLGWSDEPRLQTLAGRLAARADLDARLATWTRTQSADTAAAALQRCGISAAAVASGSDLRADRHLAARRALATVADPEIGPVRHCASPIRFDDARPLRPARPAPTLGEHTEEVLVEVLGLSAAAVGELVASGVCR